MNPLDDPWKQKVLLALLTNGLVDRSGAPVDGARLTRRQAELVLSKLHGLYEEFAR